MRSIAIAVAFVLAGAALGYVIAVAIGVSGAARAIFVVFGILLAGALAKWMGLAPESSRLR